MDKKEIMIEAEIIKEVANELQKFQLEIPDEEMNCHSQLHRALSDTINYLINNDFSRLISLLYRLDISEEKLKQLLKSAIKTSAASIIAEMIIERQAEKMKTRKFFSAHDSYGDEEKW